jgi:hypothetical protein
VSPTRLDVSVRDSGTGIDPEDLTTWIFQPFVTTKPVGKGTGLGLSTARCDRRRARRHARRDLDTQEVGTTFTLSLPWLGDFAPEAQEPRPGHAEDSARGVGASWCSSWTTRALIRELARHATWPPSAPSVTSPTTFDICAERPVARDRQGGRLAKLQR